MILTVDPWLHPLAEPHPFREGSYQALVVQRRRHAADLPLRLAGDGPPIRQRSGRDPLPVRARRGR